MSQDPTNPTPVIREYRSMQVACVFLAIASVLWVFSVGASITDPKVARIASLVARGESYDPALLRQLVATNLPGPQQTCNFKPLRDLLIMQISVSERTQRGSDLKLADADVAAVAAIADTQLKCAPTESSGWLGAYWVEIRIHGFGPRAIALLEQSYRFGPHEAWIQVIRAPLALRTFDALPADLKSSVLQDFGDVFRAQLFPSAVMLYRLGPRSAKQSMRREVCGGGVESRDIFKEMLRLAGAAEPDLCPAG